MNSGKLAFSFIWKAALRALIDPTSSIALVDLYFPEEVSWLGSSVQFYIVCNVFLLWHMSHELPVFNTPVSPVRSFLSADTASSLFLSCPSQSSAAINAPPASACHSHSSLSYVKLHIISVKRTYRLQYRLISYSKCGSRDSSNPGRPPQHRPAALSGFVVAPEERKQYLPAVTFYISYSFHIIAFKNVINT